jgi:hypothetical protein
LENKGEVSTKGREEEDKKGTAEVEEGMKLKV